MLNNFSKEISFEMSTDDFELISISVWQQTSTSGWSWSSNLITNSFNLSPSQAITVFKARYETLIDFKWGFRRRRMSSVILYGIWMWTTSKNQQQKSKVYLLLQIFNNSSVVSFEPCLIDKDVGLANFRRDKPIFGDILASLNSKEHGELLPIKMSFKESPRERRDQ